MDKATFLQRLYLYIFCQYPVGGRATAGINVNKLSLQSLQCKELLS